MGFDTVQFGIKEQCYTTLYVITVFPTLFLFADPFWLGKRTTDPHILAHENMEYPNDRYPKLKMYISELILDNLG